MKATLSTIAWILWIACIAGCAHFRSDTPANYRTLAESPLRDTETAREKTMEATACLDRGALEEAEAQLNEALIADVKYGPAHVALGTVYFRRGDFYLAAWEYEYAAREMPNRPEPHNNLGLIFESAGKLDEATDAFAYAMSLAPEEPEFLGNYLRARLKQGDRSHELRPMLEQLVMLERRPEWRMWAQQALVFERFDPPPSPMLPAPPPFALGNPPVEQLPNWLPERAVR